VHAVGQQSTEEGRCVATDSHATIEGTAVFFVVRSESTMGWRKSGCFLLGPTPGYITRGSYSQDLLTDWLSVVTWLWLWPSAQSSGILRVDSSVFRDELVKWVGLQEVLGLGGWRLSSVVAVWLRSLCNEEVCLQRRVAVAVVRVNGPSSVTVLGQMCQRIWKLRILRYWKTVTKKRWTGPPELQSWFGSQWVRASGWIDGPGWCSEIAVSQRARSSETVSGSAGPGPWRVRLSWEVTPRETAPELRRLVRVCYREL
jgi:hypothetical protein